MTTLLQDLAAALGPVVDFAATQFGVLCAIERPTEGANDELGTPTTTLAAPPGVTNPVSLALTEIARIDAQKGWGLDEDGMVSGLCNLTVPLLKGDRITPQAGELQGTVLEVRERRPVEGGSLLQFVARRIGGARR